MLTDIYVTLLVLSGVVLIIGIVATPILLNVYLKLCDKDYENNH